MAAGIPEFAVRKSLAVRERHSESFQMALRLGVPIAAGTDAGTPLNPHGSLVPEFELMVKGGLAPLAAIVSATATAARVLGLERRPAIAPGLAADLLAVAGNPAERIQALDDVDWCSPPAGSPSTGWATAAETMAALDRRAFLRTLGLAPLVGLQSCASELQRASTRAQIEYGPATFEVDAHSALVWHRLTAPGRCGSSTRPSRAPPHRCARHPSR